MTCFRSTANVAAKKKTCSGLACETVDVCNEMSSFVLAFCVYLKLGFGFVILDMNSLQYQLPFLKQVFFTCNFAYRKIALRTVR